MKLKKANSKNNSIFKQNWIIFKLLTRLFFSDYIGVFIIFILPILISVFYLILYKEGVFAVSLYEPLKKVIPLITQTKMWYEFLIYAIGFSSFVYLAISISDIKKTILFKKIISGFTTKFGVLMSLFLLYFLLTIVTIAIKFGILTIYAEFDEQIAQKTNWLWMITGLFLFVITNLSLALFISSFNISPKGLMPITIAVFFGFLFLAGLWVGPASVEAFLLNENRLKLNDTSEAKIWRGVSLISPFTPSIFILDHASVNTDGEYVYWTTNEGKIQLANFFRSLNAQNMNLENIKRTLKEITSEDLEQIAKATNPQTLSDGLKQIGVAVNYGGRDAKTVNETFTQLKLFVTKFQNNELDIALSSGDNKWFKYDIILKRQTIFGNLWSPALTSFGWCVGLNLITAYRWHSNKALA